MVRQLDAQSLLALDLLFACDTQPEDLDLLGSLPSALLGVVVSPTLPIPGGTVVVAGGEDSPIDGARLVVSPHPAVVALTHLLRPLEPLDLRRITATLLRPASMYGQDALDEVFEQTRALLAFRKPEPGDHFEAQMAFNLLPGPGDEEAIVDQLAAILDTTVPLAVQSLQAPVFHGFGISLFVELDPATDLDHLGHAYDAAPRVSRVDERELVSPVDVVASEEILVGRLRAAERLPGAFWIWAVFDNLTLGGASNALAVARRMLGGGEPG